MRLLSLSSSLLSLVWLSTLVPTSAVAALEEKRSGGELRQLTSDTFKLSTSSGLWSVAS